MDSVPIGVESILIFIYIFIFFIENLNNPKHGFIYNHHCFWISVGILLYLGGSFFINILANVFSYQELEKYWFLSHLADTIKTILFSISFILLSKNHYNKPLSQKSASLPNLDMI